MAKCIKCGGSFLTRGRIKLVDADICFKCFDSLGFDHKTGIYSGKLTAGMILKTEPTPYSLDAMLRKTLARLPGSVYLQSNTNSYLMLTQQIERPKYSP